MVGLPILSNEDIDDFFKGNPSYLGTFSKDQVANVKISKKIDSFAIMNMENEKDGGGTHWVAMYNLVEDPQYVYYFDSYGVPPPEEVISWLMQTKKEIVYSTTLVAIVISDESKSLTERGSAILIENKVVNKQLRD